MGRDTEKRRDTEERQEEGHYGEALKTITWDRHWGEVLTTRTEERKKERRGTGERNGSREEEEKRTSRRTVKHDNHDLKINQGRRGWKNIDSIIFQIRHITSIEMPIGLAEGIIVTHLGTSRIFGTTRISPVTSNKKRTRAPSRLARTSCLTLSRSVKPSLLVRPPIFRQEFCENT